MEQQHKNKEFIINYFNAFASMDATRENLEKFMTDEALISHIEFFKIAFPDYIVFADEMTAEDSRVIVKARLKGTHTGNLRAISPTYKTVDFPFVIQYTIEDNKIVNHWMLADQMALMEQLGVVPAGEAAH